MVLKLSSVKLFHESREQPLCKVSQGGGTRLLVTCRSPGRYQHLQQDESSTSEHHGVPAKGLCVENGLSGDCSTLLLL